MSELARSSKHYLDPIDRVSEVLFGLIMVLTFTGSLSVAEAGRAEVRDMLVGALGCNLAWGIIDGLFYLMGSLAERGSALLTFRAVRQESDPRKAHELIAGTLPPMVASVVKPEEVESFRQRLKALPEPPRRAQLPKEDWLGALVMFVMVIITSFPAALPFLFIDEPWLALRVSNAVLLALLFVIGYRWAGYTTINRWRAGFTMLGVGAALVAVAIALGG